MINENQNSFLTEDTQGVEGNVDRPSVKWLSTTRGSLVEKVSEGQGTARTNKLGNVVYEKMYDQAGIKIENMWIDDGMYGKQIIIATHIGDQRVNITMHNDSSYARSFYSQIFNVDVEKHFVFRPYSFVGDKGKTITGVSIKQDGKKVSKDFPEGTPDVTFKEKGGKFIVNNIEADERIEFLEDKLNELILDKDLTPPTSWFKSDDNDTPSDEDMKELNAAKRKGKSKKSNDDTSTMGDDFWNVD